MAVYALYEFTQVAQLQDSSRNEFNYIVVLMSAFMLICGYSTTTPLYSEIAVEERISWKRHMLKLSGVKSGAYWTGLLLADYVLWLIPTTLFIVAALFVGICPYNKDLGTFIGSMFGAGIAIISMSYFLGNFFDSPS